MNFGYSREKPPCHGCADRKAATKDDPKSCHAVCGKWAEYRTKNNEDRENALKAKGDRQAADGVGIESWLRYKRKRGVK